MAELAFCSGGLHGTCSECLEAYARAEYGDRKLPRQQRCAGLPCPLRAPHDADCQGFFREQALARFLSAESFDIHMDLQRVQIHAEESSKFDEMLQKIGSELQRSIPGMSKELLERQLRAAIPGARQCGQCSYGPIEHFACSDLTTHHGERRGAAQINNACPECGWFSKLIEDWPDWNGQVRTAAAAAAGAVQSNLNPVAACRQGSGASSDGMSDQEEARRLHIGERQRLAQVESDHQLAMRLQSQ